jgi:hypothetical protein
LEARFPLQKAGLYLGAVQLGTGTVLPLAPLSLPYSPEFEPRTDPEEGKKTLREIARVTGGAERTAWDDVFSARLLRNRQVKDLVIPLTLMLLLLHVTEIGGRRLLWFQRLRLRPSRLRPSGYGEAGSVRTADGETGSVRPVSPEVRRQLKSSLSRRSPKGEGGKVSPLERAKKKARNRMGR